MDLASTVKRLSPQLYRLRIFVLIIAVLAIPFTVYYLLYVRSQSGYFTDRSFRKLGTISSQIGLRVESAALVFKNTSDRFIRPLAKDSLKFDPKASDQQNFDGLKDVFKKLKVDRQMVLLGMATEPWSDKLSAGTVTLNSVRHESDSSWLYFDYVSDGIKDKTVIRVKAKTDLNKLIQPFLSPRVGSEYDQFQNILITESDTARVIFQHDATEVRLASLDKLPSSEDQAKKIDLKDITQTSNVTDVSLAGSNYRVFSHPLKISLPCSNANSPNLSWIVSGLTKSNYFQTEAWSISMPYTVLIIGGFLAALAIFSWPVLKLMLAGPKDRFKPKDVYFLVFASIVVLAVVTCFGLYAYVYTRVEAEMDDQVKDLASEIKTNFNEELTSALKQLDTFSKNGEIIRQLKSEKKNKAGTALTGRPKRQAKPVQAAHAGKTDIYQQSETNKTDILQAIVKSPSTTYKYFDSVAWIDPSGMQKAKWSVKSYTTQYIPVSTRAYFDNIRKGRFYELDDYRFWLEPVISKNTGRNQVEISMTIPNQSWIVSFDMRLLSLMDPVLPAGYGYAIIANDGKVLFHSDEAHHSGENLFQECDQNPELLAGLVGHNDKALTVRYLGEDHSFFITPLKGFPDWSLITFRNKQPLRAVFLELLTSVTILFLVYGLVVMTIFTVFYVFNVVNERRAWLWPSEKKAKIYIQSIVVLLGTSLASLVLVVLLHGEKLVWLTAGIGLFSGFAYFVNLRWGLHSPFLKPASHLLNYCKRYNRLYVVNASLLLLLVAILPAAAFFKYAYDSQITLFIKHAQYSIATALANRDERIRTQYAAIKFIDDQGSKPPQSGINEAELQEKEREQFIQNRLAESWDVQHNFFFKTSDKKPDGETGSRIDVAQTDFLAKLNTIFPLSNRASIERRGLLENNSVGIVGIAGGVGSVGTWNSAPNGRLVFHLKRDSEAVESYLNSAVPLIDLPKITTLPLVIFVLLVFLFVDYMIRKVFVLDIQKPVSHSLKTLLSKRIDSNAFVVVNAPFVKKVPGDGSNLHLKALPDIATSSNWADSFDDAADNQATVIALDRFEYGMDDPQINQQKLTLMENLLAKDRRVLIFSSAEFSQYRFSNSENGHANGTSNEIERRAGVVITDFFTEYAEDTDDGSNFKKTIDLEKERIVTQGVPGRSAKEIRDLFDTLRDECARREPLQRIGFKLLSQTGFITLRPEELIAKIGNQARAYYTHIWNSCTPGEKQTLCHLAQDRLLCHRDPDIEPLLRRELIVREHDLHLFNASFRQFVNSAERVSFVVEQDKQAQQGSLWQTLKVPILVVMLGVAAFLFLTQQDLYSRSLALMTGLTTLIPAMFKVFSMFHSDPGNRPPNQS
ncbi:MAG TPA: cache domain-containing protein [Pyrinomonadaceae bacterium]|nr:cache domain-containing protein [Pyrinomonadaceae bacterium]